ncbi:MAG: glutathione S-transferase [Rhodobacteraceae bacterium]|nr:glutathione S-transferase [Paracoccaceae bacterium]
MRLSYSPTSPYVRKVMVVLHETGQLPDVELVPTHSSPVSSEIPASPNPLGKVPALERPDGPALYDSRVITRYLDARADTGLYAQGQRLWDTLTIEATADGILDAALLMIYEDRLRPADAQYAPWVEGQWSKIDRALDTLNGLWISHLLGRLDMGQIAVGCALGYLDLRLDARNWRHGRSDLAGWYDSFATRGAMTATKPLEA